MVIKWPASERDTLPEWPSAGTCPCPEQADVVHQHNAVVDDHADENHNSLRRRNAERLVTESQHPEEGLRERQT